MDHLAEALIAVAFIVCAFALPAYYEDRDDTRLDRLRQTAVDACHDRATEPTSEGLAHCVEITLNATGQPT